jgi:prepilin-type N-terminal cleavage/methylation domain-containing protein
MLAPPPPPRSALRRRAARAANEAGFTLAEVMVVVVIVGILSTIATSYLGRDRKAAAGREFANGLTRELQRVHIQALAERLPIRAFIFRNRVELRSWIVAATPGGAPTAPAATAPLLRVITCRPGVDVLDVLTTSTPAPATQLLTTTTSAQVDFNAQGQMQFVGQALMSGAFVFIKNTDVRSNHPEALFRVDIGSLTGYVTLRIGWI